ncbi:MAG: hypothetical protein FWE84_06660 [Firmicutes bacterium]|nr:hypothetical protein [Bacillota bacterium]
MGPLIVDLPYPSTDELYEDRKSARLIAPAYAAARGEMTAILQYLFHHFNFEHGGMEAIAKTIEAIAISEMKHLDILGSALIRLGASPVFTACPPQMCNFFNACHVRYSTHPQKMLMDDIEAESGAIEDYENILARLENQQVAAIIQRILMDERLHLKVFIELLEGLNR